MTPQTLFYVGIILTLISIIFIVANAFGSFILDMAKVFVREPIPEHWADKYYRAAVRGLAIVGPLMSIYGVLWHFRVV